MGHDMPSMGSSLDSHFLSMAIIRGLWLLPLILMTGIIGFRLFVFNPLSGSLGDKVWEKEIKIKIGLFTLRWFSILLFFFALMSVVGLFHETLMITGKKFLDLSPYLMTVLEKTHWGRIWVDRILLLGALGMFWGSCMRRENLPFRWFLTLLVLISGTFSLIGHPADKGDFTGRVLVDFVHLAAISLWIGGLFPLFALVGFVRSWNLPEMTPFLTKIVERFSTMAVICVLLVILTGLFAVWSTWGRFPSVNLLLNSNYGKLFSIKIVFVLGVLAMGGLSRFYILPGLRKIPYGGQSTLANQFFLFLVAEIIFAGGVLLSAFLLTQSNPPSIPRAAHPENAYVRTIEN